jgi:outer membrane immunogenic protein
MKYLILGAAIAASTTFASVASAADVPVSPTYQLKRQQVQVFNWTGFYGGVHIGYGFGETKDAVFTGLGINTNGFVGGLQAGYISDMGIWAVGLEADISFGTLGGDANFFGIDAEHKYKYESSVRGLIGIPMNNGRLLPYVTAGVAFAKAELRIPTFGLISKDNYTGVIAGLGIRGALTNNLSWDVGYLYTDYGSQSAFGFANAVDAHNHKLRIGLKYRFGT